MLFKKVCKGAPPYPSPFSPSPGSASSSSSGAATVPSDIIVDYNSEDEDDDILVSGFHGQGVNPFLLATPPLLPYPHHRARTING